MFRTVRRLCATALAIGILGLLAASCGRPPPAAEVVVYTAHDKVFSEPILKHFELETGIRVLAKYDTEATKTIGLVNTLIEEAKAGRPRCDVFWNNEPMNTIRLKREGVLQPYHSPERMAYPPEFVDPDGCWTGLAGRMRVIIVNTKLVAPEQRPTSILDLTRPEWKGRIGIAKPLFGSTATHIAFLWAGLGPQAAKEWLSGLRANDVRICGGNRDCARLVGAGSLAAALTDTDDWLAERSEGAPVEVVYPDCGPGQMGTVFLPNTVSMIRGAPHPDEARRLIDYLLSERTEYELAESGSGQVPVRASVRPAAGVGPRGGIRTMKVTPAQAAAVFDEAMKYVGEQFLK